MNIVVLLFKKQLLTLDLCLSFNSPLFHDARFWFLVKKIGHGSLCWACIMEWLNQDQETRVLKDESGRDA
jgi:hypothetical protein